MIWEVVEGVDKALLQFDIDITACTQRALCWHVKQSCENILEENASNYDRVVDGLSRFVTKIIILKMF